MLTAVICLLFSVLCPLSPAAISYPPGVYGLAGPLAGSNPTLDPGVAYNMGLVGVSCAADWSEVQTNPDDETFFDWTVADKRVAACKAAGIANIKFGILASLETAPTWLVDRIEGETPGEVVHIIETSTAPGQYGKLIKCVAYWNTHFHNARLALHAAAGAHYANDPAIKITIAAFANTRTGDWNTRDYRGLISNIPASQWATIQLYPDSYIAGSYANNGDGTFNISVDQALQWLVAGWTSEKVIDVGKDILTQNATYYSNQMIALPIGGDDAALADAPRYQPTVTLHGNTNVTSAALTTSDGSVQKVAGFSSADIGQSITGSGIPNGTTITAVASATSATMSAAASTSNTITATLPWRADPRPGVGPGTFSTRAYKIITWAEEQTWGDRFRISRNTQDDGWDVAPPGTESYTGEGSIKYLLGTHASGVQTVTSIDMCSCLDPPGPAEHCRVHNSDPCHDLTYNGRTGGNFAKEYILSLILNIGSTPKAEGGYGFEFVELWPDDARKADLDFYAQVEAATRRMGGQPGRRPGKIKLRKI